MPDRNSDEVVHLVTATSPQEAHLWRQALEDEAIRCRVVGEYLGGFGIVPPGHPVPELWVHRDDAERAQTVLKDLRTAMRLLQDHSERRRPSIVSYVLWGFLWQTMWLSAIFGPLCIVVGAILYFVDLPDWPSFSSRQTLFQIGLFLGIEGVVFTWLRMRGYIKFCDEEFRERWNKENPTETIKHPEKEQAPTEKDRTKALPPTNAR